MKNIYFFPLIACLIGIVKSYSQTEITIREKTDALISKYNKPNSPGFALSIFKNDSIIYKTAMGIANLEYNIPITTVTPFHVASISKQFTLFSVLLLEQEGKLSIDDDIRKYIPELTDFGYIITLRNLANHTSGIREISDLTNLSGISDNDIFTNEQAIKLITNQKNINFIPGDKFEYCNSGYILLAEIVKRVSGKTFAEFATERIFKPLKMNNSFFLDHSDKIIKNLAYSYYNDNSTYYKNILNSTYVGSTGLITSVEDLGLWSQNFNKKTIGNDTIFNKMKEKSKLNNGEILSYALGQEVKNYKGLNVIFHGGGIASYRAYLLRIPEKNFSVSITSNDNDFNPLDITYKLIDYYLLDTESEVNEIKIKKTNKTILNTFIGDYEILPGLIITISRENETIYLQIKGDSEKTKLKLVNNYEFIYPNVPHSKIVFNTTDTSLKWQISDFVYNGEKVQLKKFDESKINLKDFVGEYYNAEVNTKYNFIIKDTKLVATHHKNQDINLTILQPEQLISNQGFFGKIEIIRDNQNKVIGCYVSGQRSKRIKFQKLNE